MKTFKTISPLFISLWAMTGGASASDREDDALLSAPVQSLAPITVTALKHAGNMQDVPLSIQAFSGSELAAQGITNTQQLASVVPSMLFTSIAGFPIVFLRGLGTDNFVPSCDPSISTYIDGIYLPNGVAMFNSLAGVKSVEVLKGPQGTLFGRNSDAGAISIVTAEPGNHLQLSTEGEAGNYRDRSAKLSVSGPITDWLSAGLSAIDSREDSYYSDTYYKTDPNKLAAARAKLYFHPTDNLSLDLTGYRSLQSGTLTLLAKNINPSLIGRLSGIQPAADDFSGEANYPTGSNAGQSIGYGTLKWQLPWFDIKLLGSYERLLTSYSSADFDASPQPLAGLTTTNTFTNLQTGELQILSNDKSWNADHFTWVAGAYYLQSRAGSDPGYVHVGSGYATTVGAADGGVTLAVRGVLGTRSISGYSQATYRLTPWIDVTLGGRLQHEDRYLLTAESDFPPLLPSGTQHVVQWPLQGTTSDNWSPKATLSLHPSNTTLLYASYAVGYKSGTYNIVNVFAAPTYVVPEKNTAYEIGAKLTARDGAWLLNSAIFENRITNMQSGFVSLQSAGVVNFVTVPHARSQGGELEAKWMPFKQRNSLVLSVVAAYVDAIYTDFPSGPGFQEGTGLYSGTLDMTGNRIDYAPRWSGTVSATQIVRSGRGQYEFAAEDYYNAGYFTDANNTVRQGTFAVLNARAGYRYDPWKLRITLFGQNILDRRYYAVDTQTDVGQVVTLAQPVQYGVRMTWDF